MSAVYQFQWTFTPTDYFEDKIEIIRDDYRMTVLDGRAEATVNEEVYDTNPAIRDMMHSSLNDRFLGAQIVSFRAFDLSEPTRTRIHADGRRDVFIEVKSASLVLTGHAPDILITGADGTVVYDSKRQRVNTKKSLSELVAKHKATDTTLASLLKSQDSAVRDPQNELVYLYEIRDALSAKFGGKTAAIASLGISETHWTRLGQLCNDEPLRQGRHRGKSSPTLRDATEGELQEARTIARTMLELYLRLLSNAASACDDG